jgi:hypothetical protein
MTHIHASETRPGGKKGAPVGVHQGGQFAVSLLGASVFARLAIVAAVSVFLWLAILWALA